MLGGVTASSRGRDLAALRVRRQRASSAGPAMTDEPGEPTGAVAVAAVGVEVG